jgi:hypothetical protein
MVAKKKEKKEKKEKKVLGSIFLSAWGRGKATLLTVVMALTLAMVSPALAATGGNFLLGVANTASATSTATGITQLTANLANPAMKLINTSTSAGATALNLQTATSKPPMAVNSKTKVTNLNADTVDGKSAEQLTRVANQKTSGSVFLDTTGAEVTQGDQLTITAPTSGFVRVNGNVTGENWNSTCNVSCGINGMVRHVNTNTYSSLSKMDLGTIRYANIGLDHVFPVSAGVNTFDIRLSRFTWGNGTLYGYNSSLTAEFTPYGSTGTGTP